MKENNENKQMWVRKMKELNFIIQSAVLVVIFSWTTFLFNQFCVVTVTITHLEQWWKILHMFLLLE